MRILPLHDGECYINTDQIEDIHVAGSESDASVIIRMVSGKEHTWKRFASKTTMRQYRNMDLAREELERLLRKDLDILFTPQRETRGSYADIQWPGKELTGGSL